MTEEANHAFELIRRFEGEPRLLPSDAERLIASVFRACGFTVRESGFVEGAGEVDCQFQIEIGGKLQRVAVEVKFGSRASDTRIAEQALRMLEAGPFDRSIVVSRGGFTPAAQTYADGQGAGRLDLLTPADLRNWLKKFVGAPALAEEPSVAKLVRDFIEDLAMALGKNIDGLADTNWLNLELALGVAFRRIGYDVVVTPATKDGGFDLELKETAGPGKGNVYLIEVKHWNEQKPGVRYLTKLAKVTASLKPSGAIMLSSSGFTNSVYSGLLEIDQPISLGERDKIGAIFRTYYRLNTGFWLPGQDVEWDLFAGTRNRTSEGGHPHFDRHFESAPAKRL